jgi:hypothetical protein
VAQTWYARLLTLALLAVEPCSASDFEKRAGQLRQLVRVLDIQPKVSTSLASPQFCRHVLDELTAEDSKVLVPAIQLASYDEAALEPFIGKCASLDLSEWHSPDGLPYHATGTFRVFELPKSVANLDRESHFVLFADSYFNSFVKGQFSSNAKIHEFAGFAWPDGNGGGGIYSVVDKTHCAFRSQLVVHGEYNHVSNQATPHFSEPFVLGNRLYVYDFHNYKDASHNHAGLVVWDLGKPEWPRQACSYGSADDRALLKSSLGSPNKSLERTRER